MATKNATTLPGFFNCVEAGEALGLSPDTVRQHINRKIIRGVKVSKTWFVPESEVKRYKVERRPQGRPS